VTLTFRTVVLDVPPSPLGMSPGRIVIEHHCDLCRATVVTAELGAHARGTARRR
jgi:hypothetical protein